MFVSFLLGARYLELRARHRAAEALEGALACLPETAWRVAADGSVAARRPASPAAGRPRARAGGPGLPGRRRAGERPTQADEALLSGESRPVAKAAGDAWSPAASTSARRCSCACERVGEDTRYEAIVALMRSAMSQRPASARLADRWAGALPVGGAAAGGGGGRGVERDRPVARGVGGGVGADRHLPLRAVAGRAGGAARRGARPGAPRRAGAAARCLEALAHGASTSSSTRPAR